jgi:hypothetical protein
MKFPWLNNDPLEASTRQQPLLFRLVAMLLPVLLVSLGLAATGGPGANAATAATDCSASSVSSSARRPADSRRASGGSPRSVHASGSVICPLTPPEHKKTVSAPRRLAYRTSSR